MLDQGMSKYLRANSDTGLFKPEIGSEKYVDYGGKP